MLGSALIQIRNHTFLPGCNFTDKGYLASDLPRVKQRDAALAEGVCIKAQHINS